MNKLGLLVIFLLFILSGCGNGTTTIKDVSVDTVSTMMDKHEAQIIDVRTPEEFAAGHIPSAVNLPLQDLENQLSKLDKQKSYIMVCRSGNRSKQASELLVSKGYQHISNMLGGMNQWKGPVVQ